MKKVMFIFGTRPEAIKMAPVILKFKKCKSIKTVVCFTGQHREIALDVLKLFKIKPDEHFNTMLEGQSLAALSERLMHSIDLVLESVKPDLVLVQGDTTSAFVGALCAFYRKIPIGHIEAGMRTLNKNEPFPEEFNRCAITKMADLNFCPTAKEDSNIICETAESGNVVGNTIVDALNLIKLRTFRQARKEILVTTHRRENLGKPLQSICLGINKLAEKHKDILVSWFLHPNPEVQKTVRKMTTSKRILLFDATGYFQMLEAIKNCHFIISDSGGIQEEAPSFGKPVLILRNVTERPQGVSAGIAKLIGTDSKNIVKEASLLLNDKNAYQKMVAKENPYGDGKSSERILKIVKDYLL